MMADLPPRVRAEVQRILDREAQRLLCEELANAHRVANPDTTAIHPVVNDDQRCADCEQPIPMGQEFVLTFKAELRPERRGGARYCMTCAQERELLAEPNAR